MLKSNRSKKYLEILIDYSMGVYNLVTSQFYENGIPDKLESDEKFEEFISAIIEILSDDMNNQKISSVEMAHISVFIGEKIFGINRILNEFNIEEKIFERLLDNVDDRTIAFLMEDALYS